MNALARIGLFNSARGDRPILFVAALPIADAVVNQVQTVFQPAMGSLSLLQVYRGALLALMLIVLALELPKFIAPVAYIRMARNLFAVIGLFVATAIVREIWLYSELQRTSMIAMFQILFWGAYAPFIAVLCTTRQRLELMCWGQFIGGLLSALSVSVAYYYGEGVTYEFQNVYSSSGWFHTAKGLTGPILVSAILAIFLLYERMRITSVAIAIALMVVTFLTQARASQMAIIGVFLLLAWWYVFIGRRQIGLIAAAAFIVGTIAALAYLFSGVQFVADFETRWEDIFLGDKAGSGRVLLWSVSIARVENFEFFEALFGISFEGMFRLTEDFFGDAIHTHSDFFDFLIIGGLLGVAAYAYMVRVLVQYCLRPSLYCPEFVFASAVFITFIAHSLSTGQVFAPNTMTSYLVGIVCVSGLGTMSAKLRQSRSER